MREVSVEKGQGGKKEINNRDKGEEKKKRVNVQKGIGANILST